MGSSFQKQDIGFKKEKKRRNSEEREGRRKEEIERKRDCWNVNK